MGRVVIAAFKPKPGQRDALLALVQRHWRVLHDQGLVTDRPRVAMQAADGTVIEVFEWRSSQAVDSAHADATVRALWSEFDAACDYLPIGAVPEAQRLFSEFDALPL
jgi:hypothetical protein